MDFIEEKTKLNSAQLDAVESIDGPVMVIAGPGTGKTDVLTLRIANILQKTDTGPDSILCLTFTNSGVKSMRSRLENYIGPSARNVSISTFHSFALSLIENYYELLDFASIPKLIDPQDSVFLYDEILHDFEWEYLRPRANPSQYFGDLKHLVSILKRERITEEQFAELVHFDIEEIKNNPDNISSRGESKGQLKQESIKKIESLSRTLEVVEFYKKYEERKKSLGLIDYDDALELAVKIVEQNENARADILEKYLYVLVDEHQDSSSIQNDFLKAVWKDEEKPNIFVVGDDRQLIYGFSGASLPYFEEFKHIFGKVKLINLFENYRSTSPILSLADDLLSSSLVDAKLKSNRRGDTKVKLSEYSYPRDEIIGAGLYFKEQIKNGTAPKDCALLVPKNYHVREATTIFKMMGIPVTDSIGGSLFDIAESDEFLRLLALISNPFDSIILARALFDGIHNIPSLESARFLKSIKPDKLTVDDIIFSQEETLFPNYIFGHIFEFGKRLEMWTNDSGKQNISEIISAVGNDVFLNGNTNHEQLLSRVEILRSLLHLASHFEKDKKHKHATLSDFINYINRLREYGTSIDIASFAISEGVNIMTLHKSKGLQYQCVWIAHMNEETLMSSKKGGFVLPEKIKEKMDQKDILTAKRELYVAITRAKDECTISFAYQNDKNSDLKLANIIKDLPDIHFDKKTKEETESELLANGAGVYVPNAQISKSVILDDVLEFVKNTVTDSRVSVTLLNNFFECPWKWYFRNFLKLPDVKTPSLAIGTVVHATIEDILKYGLKSDKEIKEKIVELFEREGITDKKQIADFSKSVLKSINNWIEEYYKNLAKDYVSERNLSRTDSEFPNFNFFGKVDLTERIPDGSIVISDFKTGKSKTKNEIEKMGRASMDTARHDSTESDGRLSSYMRQLAMYSYLIEGAEKRDVSISRLLFLEAEKKDKNKIYSTHIDQEKIDLLKRDIADYVKMTQEGTWIDHPCDNVHFGKDECEYCKLAKTIFK